MNAHVSESGHWYTRDGKPIYECPSADGKKMVNITIVQARKLGLLPGCTSVIKILASPGLERWKVRQGIMAALTLSRIGEETDAEYLDRIEADSKAHAKKRAEEGTLIHAAVEGFMRGESYDIDLHPHVSGTMQELNRLFTGHKWQPEVVKVHQMGYGCRIDGVSSLGVVGDWKTKEFAPEAKDYELFYDEHIMQLAANKRAAGATGPCVSVIINVKHPGTVRTKVWSAEEEARGLSLFDAAHRLWCLKNKYEPSWS